MLKQCITVSLLIITLTHSSQAQAQTEGNDTDIIKVTGLRPSRLQDVTSSVTVLTPESLAIRNAPYLADALRAVPGIAVSRSGATGGLTQIRTRGSEANHTLVLLNGIELSDPMSGEVDWGLISGLARTRIELLRGEQSGLYGSDAIGGVIDITTSNLPGGTGYLEAGSRNTFRLQTGYTVGGPGRHASGHINRFATRGVDTSGQGGEVDGSNNLSLLLTGETRLGTTSRLTGLVRIADDQVETDSDVDFDGLLDDTNDHTKSDQFTLGSTLTTQVIGLDHLLTASWHRVERSNYAMDELSTSAEGQRTKVSYSPSQEFHPSLAQAIRLSGLIEYEREDYRAGDILYGGLTNQDQHFETFGFASDIAMTFDRANLNLSVRRDDNGGQFDDATTGRIGVSYGLGQLGRLRASAGSGIKNPTFTELFGFFPGTFVGNPDLQPEKSSSWEVGWDFAQETLSLSTSYFQAELEAEIYTAFDANFNSTAKNRIGKSDRSGLEVGWNWHANEQLVLNGQFTSIRSAADDGEREIRVPRNTASLSGVFIPNSSRIDNISISLDHVGEQDDFDFGTFPARRIKLDSYTLTSFSAVFPLSPSVSLHLRGDNIFDADAMDVFGYHTAGAGLFAGIRVNK